MEQQLPDCYSMQRCRLTLLQRGLMYSDRKIKQRGETAWYTCTSAYELCHDVAQSGRVTIFVHVGYDMTTAGIYVVEQFVHIAVRKGCNQRVTQHND